MDKTVCIDYQVNLAHCLPSFALGLVLTRDINTNHNQSVSSVSLEIYFKCSANGILSHNLNIKNT